MRLRDLVFLAIAVAIAPPLTAQGTGAKPIRIKAAKRFRRL
jgi:hypothetical protein